MHVVHLGDDFFHLEYFIQATKHRPGADVGPRVGCYRLVMSPGEAVDLDPEQSDKLRKRLERLAREDDDDAQTARGPIALESYPPPPGAESRESPGNSHA